MKAMMTIEQMKKRKQELGYSYKRISELSGVPLGTVQKVFSGLTKSPRHETLLALASIFSYAPDKDPKTSYDLSSDGASVVRESSTAYAAAPFGKKQGEYTLDDYYALPDDVRVELIDGVIYDMTPAPSALHQILSAEICRVLRNEIEKRGGPCIPFAAPTDVQLNCDNRTMVQPDVFVICDREKVKFRNIYGAPDFAIEILSPSTRKKDMRLKAYKYADAGVREYWLVDPVAKQVLVYDFEHDEMPVIYGFDSRIPVSIFGDDFVIDFAKIYDYISFIYDDE